MFYNTTIKELLVGKGVSSLKETLYGLEALEKIEVEEGNESYISEEGVLYNKEKTTLIRYPQSKSDQTEYKVPEGVKIIGENAFRENKTITKVELPKSVQSIKNYAFLCCEGLEEIKLSEGLEAIGNNAFANCNGIKKADLPDSVKALGADTFYDCDSLEEVVLGKGLEKVGDDTFRYCEKLTKLTVKGNIESINSCLLYTSPSPRD